MPANNANSSTKDFEVDRAFVRTKLVGRVDRAACRYCKNSAKPYERSWNTSFLREHLVNCKPYQDVLQRTVKDGDKRPRTMTMRQQIDEDEAARLERRPAIAVAKNPYYVAAAPKSNKAVDKLYAKAIFSSCCSFSIFESPEWVDFFNSLGYYPPKRTQLSTTLLDDVYIEVKKEVTANFASCEYLGIVADESSNVAGTRIENISVICDQTSYHWKSESIGDQDSTADEVLKSIRKKALEITGQELSRLSSLTTDTCDTQRLAWKKIHQEPELKHVFAVGCDSHGLQLVIKDLLDPPKQHGQLIRSKIRDTIGELQAIVSFFHKSKKQLAILRAKQILLLQNHVALASSVITRWGSQNRSIQAILKSEQPLKLYLNDNRADCDPRVRDIIQDVSFWARLYSLGLLIQPIHEMQLMSESSHSTLEKVFIRWRDLMNHLYKQSQPGESLFQEEVLAYIELRENRGGFTRRIKRQLQPIHILAYILHPKHRADWDEAFLPQYKNAVIEFLEDYAGEDTDQVLEHFFAYLHQTGPFRAMNACWRHTSNPSTFWLIADAEAKILASLATRLLNTSANSVASEQSFSVMNLLHTKTRNRMDPERVDKLIFIYVNLRALRKDRSSIMDEFDALVEEDLVIVLNDDLRPISDLDEKNEHNDNNGNTRAGFDQGVVDIIGL